MDTDLTLIAASASFMALVGSVLPWIRDWFESRRAHTRLATSTMGAGEVLILNVGTETFKIDVSDISTLDTVQLQKALVSVNEARSAQSRSAA